jgi:hypothetical protein
MRTTAIYELNVVTDDPRLEGFALAPSPSVLGRESLDDDLTPGFADAEENPDWKQPSLAEHWPTPRAEGRVSEFNDYPCLDMVLPAFSERAVDALGDLLEASGEILLLSTNTDAKFYFFNILTISDALDRSASSCDFWCDPPTTATDIEFFVFDAKKVQGLSIFRIRELPMSVFVTNVFVDRVESCKLQGFDFKKVWPLARGVHWRMQTDQDAEERKQLKRHTLVLLLPISGSHENNRIAAFENAMDARLRVESLESEYFGSYEGHDIVENEYRMFFSCPDVDRLLDYIRDDVRQLQWSTEIKVCRRYGRIYETNIRKEMSSI